MTHLARNAESHARMFAAATDGRETEQYEGGRPARNAAIEQGAGRPAVELIADVRTTIYQLESTWFSATAVTWSGFGIKSHADGARVRIADLVMMRWRETEVHHADLACGFTYSDWDPEYVRRDLDLVAQPGGVSASCNIDVNQPKELAMLSLSYQQAKSSQNAEQRKKLLLGLHKT